MPLLRGVPFRRKSPLKRGPYSTENHTQAEATKEAQRAGIEHAKASGERYKGRKPSFTRSQLKMVQDMLGQEAGVSAIAKTTGLSRQTIYRIRDDAASSEAALATWGQ